MIILDALLNRLSPVNSALAALKEVEFTCVQRRTDFFDVPLLKNIRFGDVSLVIFVILVATFVQRQPSSATCSSTVPNLYTTFMKAGNKTEFSYSEVVWHNQNGKVLATSCVEWYDVPVSFANCK
jgi:hypothetical protein